MMSLDSRSLACFHGACRSAPVGHPPRTCHAGARAYVFGELWDEIDISRSHVKAVFGCWTLTGNPRPSSLLRYIAEPDRLEADIAAELTAAHPHREADLAHRLLDAGGVPTPHQARRIAYARKALFKCSMLPKQVLSAMINARSELSWSIPFDGRDSRQHELHGGCF